MLKKIEEFEEREKAAMKKIARLEEVIAKDKNESATLRRSCSLTEHQLDKTEDILDQKLERLVMLHKKTEQDIQMLKVLEDRELEVDNSLDRLEPSAKAAIQRQHDAEMRCMEVQRRLTLTTSELHKIRARQREKEEEVRELENRLKVGGRSIQQLVISEEKYCDKEDEFRHRIRLLKANLAATILRAEESERRCMRLERENDMVEEETRAYKKNYDMMQKELHDTLNDIECV
nr:tropomyosin 4 [Nematostella vectensis]